MTLATLTSFTTSLLEHHGALAIFLLLAVDAVLPVGGELPMILAGATAAGAIGHGTSLLAIHVDPGIATYLVLSIAGTLGYLLGSFGGWLAGRRGGHEFVERHGRWLHLTPARFAQAERWFARHGSAAVLLGRVTPFVRSFISVAAGVLGAPLPSYLALTAIGATVWCFGLAAAGWALGSNWDVVHSAFRYVDIAVVAGIVALCATVLIRRRRVLAARP